MVANLCFACHHFQFYADLSNFPANTLASKQRMMLSATTSAIIKRRSACRHRPKIFVTSLASKRFLKILVQGLALRARLKKSSELRLGQAYSSAQYRRFEIGPVPQIIHHKLCAQSISQKLFSQVLRHKLFPHALRHKPFVKAICKSLL